MGRGSGRHKSTGLGLAVVAAVVAAHNGTIDLETGPEGTTLLLPFRATQPQ